MTLISDAMSAIGFAGGSHASAPLTVAMEGSDGICMKIGFLSQGSRLKQGPLFENRLASTLRDNTSIEADVLLIGEHLGLLKRVLCSLTIDPDSSSRTGGLYAR